MGLPYSLSHPLSHSHSLSLALSLSLSLSHTRTHEHQAEKDISDARERATLFDVTIVNDELAEAYDALKQVLRGYPHMREMMTRMQSTSG
jgi:guanylate kinase